MPTLSPPMTDDASRPLGLAAQLREDLHCVFQRDPAARTRFEVLTTYPGVHAILGHRLAHRLWTRLALPGAAVELCRAAVRNGHPPRRGDWPPLFIDHGACG